MVALDAMGGDFAPEVTVKGALRAAKKGVAVSLFGDETKIKRILDKRFFSWHRLPITVVHCSQEISMDEEPTKAVLQKKDSSLVRAVNAVMQGKAQVVISAGNTGASLVAGALILRTIKSISRPAVGDFLPTRTGSVFCIDLGANADCKPEYLVQFATMGHAYVKLIKNISSPRIGILSNGSEQYKGSQLVKQAYALLRASDLNFIGNVEANTMFDGSVDVVVTDGFAGNVMLKTAEGVAGLAVGLLKEERSRSLFGKVLFALGAPIMGCLKRRIDSVHKGGALLFGVQKPLIVAHGSSSAKAIKNAILFAQHVVKKNYLTTFNQEVEQLLSKTSKISNFVAKIVRQKKVA